MKKTLLIMVMALAVLLTQCRKPEVKFPSPVAPEGTTVSMTVTAGPGSKTDITTAGGITWSTGDRIYVGHNNAYIGYLTIESGVGTPTGTFSGDVMLPTGTTDEQTFHFFYLGSGDYTSLTKGTSTEVAVSFATQNIYNNGGNLENASKHHVGYGSASGTVKDGVVTGINVTLVSKVALARFSFTEAAGKGAYTDQLTLSGTGIYNSMTVGFGGTFDHGATAGNINLGAVSGGISERYVMLVPVGSDSETLNFGGGAIGSTILANGIEANKFYGRESAIAVPLVAQKTVNFGTPDLNWSVCNLGATNGSTAESWYGDYYQWGGVTPVTSTEIYISWDGCPFTNGTYSTDNTAVFTKYVPKDMSATYGYGGYGDDKTVLDAVDDAATANWGSDWRMPTTEEWKSLYDNNTFEWLDAGAPSTNVSSFTAVAAGYLVVKGGKNSIDLDASVYMFLPAAGSRDLNDLNQTGIDGDYWASSLYSDYPIKACRMCFYNPDVYSQETVHRYVGYSVRPARPAH